MVQAGITRIDNFTLIDRMLEQTKEPVSLIVGSFAVVEGWLKRMFRLKEQGKVIRLELVLNSSILTRHREMILLLEQICDAGCRGNAAKKCRGNYGNSIACYVAEKK